MGHVVAIVLLVLTLLLGFCTLMLGPVVETTVKVGDAIVDDTDATWGDLLLMPQEHVVDKMESTEE